MRSFFAFIVGAGTILGLGVYGAVTKFEPKEALVGWLKSKKAEKDPNMEWANLDHGCRGSWSGWSKKDAGLMVANDRSSYDRIVKCLNTSNTTYDIKGYDDAYVYICVFGGEIKRKPGHDIEVSKIKRQGDDFVVCASVKAPKSLKDQDEPCSSWVLLKIAKIDMAPFSNNARFYLDLTVVNYDYIPQASTYEK